MLDEVETPYRKSSTKASPPKADHKHEYVIVFTMNRIRRFDGSISDKKYKFTLPSCCIDCGHTLRRRRGSIEMEVTPREFLRIEKERT